MKKTLKILPIVSFVIGIIAYIIVWTTQESRKTTYHTLYSMGKASWAFLLAIPLCVVSLVLAIKFKDRIAIIISVVLSIIAVAIFGSSFLNAQKYSFDEKDLIYIEEKANIDFPSDASIIVDGSAENNVDVNGKKAKCVKEGAIWFEEEYNFYDRIKSDTRWESKMPDDGEKFISTTFESATLGCDHYFYESTLNGEIIILAYDKDRNLVYFSCYEMKG